MVASDDVTQLLRELSGGDEQALDRLLPIIYEELKYIAHNQRRGERPNHTLNTTALVHEAYFKLVQIDRVSWQDRGHFFAMACRAMRRVLVNHALRRKALKRGGGAPHVSAEDHVLVSEEQADEVLALDAALQRLQAMDERQYRVVECRFFGGLTIEETAEVLQVSPATVKRDWQMARLWLNRELSD